MRLLIHRTNPDGTRLFYGSLQVQFVSGNYAWDLWNTEDAPAPARAGGPGGAGGPGAGRGGPTIRESSVAATRRTQILLTPPAFIKAALQNNATVTMQGASRLITVQRAGTAVRRRARRDEPAYEDYDHEPSQEQRAGRSDLHEIQIVRRSQVSVANRLDGRRRRGAQLDGH